MNPIPKQPVTQSSPNNTEQPVRPNVQKTAETLSVEEIVRMTLAGTPMSISNLRYALSDLENTLEQLENHIDKFDLPGSVSTQSRDRQTKLTEQIIAIQQAILKVTSGG